MITTIEVVCEFCNKKFTTPIWEYNKFLKGKKKHICCSRDCANKLIGKNHSGKNNHKYVEKTMITCEFCGKEVEAYDYQLKYKKYCSKECKNSAKTRDAKVVLQCMCCGKDFYRFKGEISFWGTIKYCSEKCRKESRVKKAELICIICGKHYFVSNNRKNTSVCCSYECIHKWVSTIYTEIPEVKDRLRKQGAKSQLNQKKEFTIPEIIVLEYLNKHGINFIPQHPINDILVVDFFLADFNCVLEVYGDYWHGNPLKYGEDKRPLNAMQIKNKQKDIRRYKVLTKKCGFYFYSLWEYDIKNDLESCMNKFFKYIDSKIRNEQVVLQ